MLKTVAAQAGATGTLTYAGTWNASTNTPTLTSGAGILNNYYVVNVAGSTNLDGITDWQVGDWAIFNGTIWQKIDQTSAVTSVNGQTGAVTLTASSVGATPNTTYVIAGGLLSGGGQLNGNVTVSLTDVPVANVTGAVSNAVNVLAGTGMSGGGALTGNVTINLANTAVTAGTYGNASAVSQFTVDAQGRLTNASNVSISIASGNVTGLGTMATQNSNNVTITGGNVNVQTTNLTSTTSSSATFATSSLPLVPAGYIQINLNGTVVKIPYYAV
jgi:hypothetical protein